MGSLEDFLAHWPLICEHWQMEIMLLSQPEAKVTCQSNLQETFGLLSIHHWTNHHAHQAKVNRSGAGFLSLSTVDILGWKNLCCRRLSCVGCLAATQASTHQMSAAPSAPGGITKNVSRYG